jgi:hypothetical protein
MQVIGTGRQIDIVNLIISPSVDTQIGFHYKQSFNEVLIRERTTNGLQLRFSPNDSDYWTIPSGSTLDLSVLGNPDGSYNLYIRSASGTSTVEVIGVFGE